MKKVYIINTQEKKCEDGFFCATSEFQNCKVAQCHLVYQGLSDLFHLRCHECQNTASNKKLLVKKKTKIMSMGLKVLVSTYI